MGNARANDLCTPTCRPVVPTATSATSPPSRGKRWRGASPVLLALVVASCAPERPPPSAASPRATAAPVAIDASTSEDAKERARIAEDAAFSARAKDALDRYARGDREESARAVARLASDMATARAVPLGDVLRHGAPRGYPVLSPDGRHVLHQHGNHLVRETIIQERHGAILTTRTDVLSAKWVAPELLIAILAPDEGPVEPRVRLWDVASGAMHPLPFRPEQLTAAGERVVVLRGAPTTSIDVLDRGTLAPMRHIVPAPSAAAPCDGCRVMTLADDGSVLSWFDGGRTQLFATDSGTPLLGDSHIDRVAFLPKSHVAALWSGAELEKVELPSGRLLARLRRPTHGCTSTRPEWDRDRFTVSTDGAKVLDFDRALTIVDAARWTALGTVVACSRIDAAPEECVYPINQQRERTPIDPRFAVVWWKGGASFVSEAATAKPLTCGQRKAWAAAQRTRPARPGAEHYTEWSTNIAPLMFVDLTTLADVDDAQAKALQDEAVRRDEELNGELGRVVCSVGDVAGDFVFPREMCPLEAR